MQQGHFIIWQFLFCLKELLWTYASRPNEIEQGKCFVSFDSRDGVEFFLGPINTNKKVNWYRKAPVFLKKKRWTKSDLNNKKFSICFKEDAGNDSDEFM
jgi:hypothetical protein